MELSSLTRKPSPILWQNEEQTVTLIDILRSTADAQGTPEQPCEDILLSTEPLQTPYQTNEPNSAVAKAKVANNAVDAELHDQHAAILERALEDVASSRSGAWCSPRPFVAKRLNWSKKRKIDADSSSDKLSSDGTHAAEDARPTELPSDLLSSFAVQGLTRCNGLSLEELDKFDESAEKGAESIKKSPPNAQLTLPHPTDQASSFNFRIPPESSFTLSSCANPTLFHTLVRTAAQALSTRRTFDFILLDPPWPSRSVKRTHKTANSTYATSPTLYGIHNLISGMDLDILMAHNCLVGIWITNKAAVRELVLDQGGLFDCWGVELAEEWVWLKTTVEGAPVTPLRSTWRKPYEVLLLGRKRAPTYAPARMVEERGVKRRVLVSVPDLHSRKPCLKELIEPLMPDAQDYRALEIFARHLAAGWWSWGDECIKYNWEGYWRKPTSSEASERGLSSNA